MRAPKNTNYDKNIDKVLTILRNLKGIETGYVRYLKSMQCCGQILQDSFDTYKTFPRCKITEIERQVDVQNHKFGGYVFRIDFLIFVKKQS